MYYWGRGNKEERCTIRGEGEQGIEMYWGGGGRNRDVLLGGGGGGNKEQRTEMYY